MASPSPALSPSGRASPMPHEETSSPRRANSELEIPDWAQSGLDNSPQLEQPWWTKVHGDSNGQPVTNLDEVMDQFLCDTQALALETICNKATKKFDVRKVDSIVPDIGKEQLEEMQKWYGHVTKFTKYRTKVGEKQQRAMEVRMQRRGPKQDVWEEEESDSDDGASEAPSVVGTPSVRSEARSDGGRSSSMGTSSLGLAPLRSGSGLERGARHSIMHMPPGPAKGRQSKPRKSVMVGIGGLGARGPRMSLAGSGSGSFK